MMEQCVEQACVFMLLQLQEEACRFLQPQQLFSERKRFMGDDMFNFVQFALLASKNTILR
jgi:hypothetical protein